MTGIGRFIGRVELRQADTHVVIRTEHVFPGEHPELVLATVRRRLGDGEQAVSERGARSEIRIVLPQRLQLRGGRTTMTGNSDEPRGQINPGLVGGLKRAHADLLGLRASPFTAPADLVDAAAPATQHDRQVCRLAFMAPELQRQILAGHQPPGMGLRHILKSQMPLAWADQKAWLEVSSRR